MSEVTFIDSSAMAMMLWVHNHAVAQAATLNWRGLRPTPARALSVMGLEDLLNIER